MVEPSTTWLFSDSPLKAATVRVVRLLAAAIDHNVSPGITTCPTAAPAGDAGARRKAAAAAEMDTAGLSLRTSWTSLVRTNAASHSQAAPPGRAAARAYVALQAGLRRRAHAYVPLHAILLPWRGSGSTRRISSSGTRSGAGTSAARCPGTARGCTWR